LVAPAGRRHGAVVAHVRHVARALGEGGIVREGWTGFGRWARSEAAARWHPNPLFFFSFLFSIVLKFCFDQSKSIFRVCPKNKSFSK